MMVLAYIVAGVVLVFALNPLDSVIGRERRKRQTRRTPRKVRDYMREEEGKRWQDVIDRSMNGLPPPERKKVKLDREDWKLIAMRLSAMGGVVVGMWKVWDYGEYVQNAAFWQQGLVFLIGHLGLWLAWQPVGWKLDNLEWDLKVFRATKEIFAEMEAKERVA